MLTVAEQHGLEGLGGEKGLHTQSYETIMKTENVDDYLRKLVMRLWNKGGTYYPDIKTKRDGRAKMDGLKRVKSGEEYVRVMLPYAGVDVGSVAEYRGDGSDNVNNYVYMDIPVQGRLSEVIDVDFLNQVRSKLEKNKSQLLPILDGVETHKIDDWMNFEQEKKDPPSMVIRWKTEGDQELDRLTDELARDSRIPIFMDVDYHEDKAYGLSGLGLKFRMAHAQYDGAPIKKTIEELAHDSVDKRSWLMLSHDEMKRAIQLADDWFELPPKQPEIVPYDLKNLKANPKGVQELAASRHTALQEASYELPGTERFARILGIYEQKYRLEWSRDFFQLIKEVGASYKDESNRFGKKLEIPTSIYLALAMRAIYGGAVVVPVEPSQGGRMELSGVPATDESLDLVKLLQIMDTRLDLDQMQGTVDADIQHFVGENIDQFKEITTDIRQVIEAYGLEIQRALDPNTKGGGATTRAVRHLGNARWLVQELVGMRWAGETVESLNGSTMLSTMGRLNVPEGVFLRGHFETAGDKNVDQAVANMGNEIQLKWFTNDTMGMFFTAGYFLNKSGVDEFTKYLSGKTQIDCDSKGQKKTIDLEGTKKMWAQYVEAFRSSQMIDGMAIPEKFLPEYGKIIKNKKERARFEADADGFLAVLTDWLEEKYEGKGKTVQGSYEVHRFNEKFIPMFEKVVEWKTKALLYTAGCYLVAMQLDLDEDGFANLEKNALDQYVEKHEDKLGVGGAYALLLKLRKDVNNARNEMNNIAAGRGRQI